MDELLEVSDQLIRNTTTTFKRYLSNEIDWNERLIGIKGARGTGKTTLIFQYLKENQHLGKKVDYFSLNELFFVPNTLIEITKAFYHFGGKIFSLDEIHKYTNWSRKLKNRYPEFQQIFSGSSILDVHRRKVI